MADPLDSVRANCFVEFRVMDKKRFEIMLRFFEPLRDYTHNSGSQSANIDDTTANRHMAMTADATQESRQVSAAMEETKQRNNFVKPEEWLLAFRPQDLEYMNLPKHKEAILALREWQGLSRRERRKILKQTKEDSLQSLADFVDMMRYWQSVEYELVGCEMHESDRGRITYSTFKYPFEGKVAIEELLLFFGFFSIINDSC